MVEIILKGRTEIKKHIGKILDLATLNQNGEARVSVKQLRKAVFKHYASSDQKHYPQIVKEIDEIDWALWHFRRLDWRIESIEKNIKRLIMLLKKEEENDTIQEQIARIYQNIQEDFLGCLSGKIEDNESINEDFLSLQKLSNGVQKQSSDISERYIQVMKNVGVCRAILPRIVSVSGTKTLKKEDVNSLTQSFSVLYSSLADLISSFDATPVSKEKKQGLKDQIVEDLEEQKKEVLRAQAIDLLNRDWRLSDTARHLNLTLDELRELLGLDGDDDKGDDEIGDDE